MIIFLKLMENIIVCEGITKRYGDNIALDNVTVAVPKGRIYGLLGPNGAGKSTMIRIINRIILPTEGHVMYDGRPMVQDDVMSIGYLPEERGLYKKMKVGEQAMYLARLKGMKASEAERELKGWFVKFGIQAWWDKKVEELSKGMAQKVQFITTVLHRPSLLILDEPFSGFDPVNAQLVRDEILRLRNEGTSVILSTHSMESVEELCDSITLINRSKVVVQGAVNEIRERYGKNNVEVLYNASEAVELPLSSSYSVLSDDEFEGRRRKIIEVAQGSSASSVLRAVLDSGIDPVSYRKLMPRMNEIFINLVTGGK